MALPRSMTVVDITEYGAPDVLKPATAPVPAPGERFLVHGGASGIGTTAIQLARLRGARVIAAAGSDETCAACRALEAEVWPHLESGAIAPVMDSVFPLERAAEAHARMESSANIGKIVLEVGGA